MPRIYVINSMAMLRGVTSDTSQIDKMVRDQKLEKVRMGKGEEGEPAQKGPMTIQEEVGLVTQRSQLTPATLPAARYPLCRCYRYIQCSDLVYHARYATGRNQQVGKDILEPLRGAVWLYERPSNAVSLGLKFLLPPQVIQLTSSIRAGSQPGTSQSPSSAMSTPVKHPQTFQRPQHPQPPCSATNHNSERPNLLDQAELGCLYKPARSSISKESTTRSHRDNFSGSNLSFTGLQRSHRDYFSVSPSRQLNKNVSLTDPYREALTAVSKRTGPAQTPPRAALPDVHLDIGAALPEAAATCRIPHVDHPPVVLDIPGSTVEWPEPLRRTDSPSRGPRSPRRSHKRPRNRSSPSPRRPRKRPSTAGRWCE